MVVGSEGTLQGRGRCKADRTEAACAGCSFELSKSKYT